MQQTIAANGRSFTIANVAAFGGPGVAIALRAICAIAPGAILLMIFEGTIVFWFDLLHLGKCSTPVSCQLNWIDRRDKKWIIKTQFIYKTRFWLGYNQAGQSLEKNDNKIIKCPPGEKFKKLSARGNIIMWLSCCKAKLFSPTFHQTSLWIKKTSASHT